jgi:hypothetical protein
VLIELAQVVLAVFCTPTPVELATEVEVEEMLAWPPTPRAQTPPPGWSGAGLPGAETKALPCWVRKTLLTLPIAPAIAALAAPGAIARVPMLVMKVPVVLVWVVAQFWANADDADINTVTTAPASTLRFRFAIDAMKIILSPQKRIGHIFVAGLT